MLIFRTKRGIGGRKPLKLWRNIGVKFEKKSFVKNENKTKYMHHRLLQIHKMFIIKNYIPCIGLSKTWNLLEYNHYVHTINNLEQVFRRHSLGLSLVWFGWESKSKEKDNNNGCQWSANIGPGVTWYLARVEKRAGVLYFGLKTQIEQNLFIDSYTYYDITNYRYINFICARDRS